MATGTDRYEALRSALEGPKRPAVLTFLIVLGGAAWGLAIASYFGFESPHVKWLIGSLPPDTCAIFGAILTGVGAGSAEIVAEIGRLQATIAGARARELPARVLPSLGDPRGLMGCGNCRALGSVHIRNVGLRSERALAI